MRNNYFEDWWSNDPGDGYERHFVVALSPSRAHRVLNLYQKLLSESTADPSITIAYPHLIRELMDYLGRRLQGGDPREQWNRMRAHFLWTQIEALALRPMKRR